MVSKELLEELRAIIREQYGWDLSPKEVSEIGNGLVDYFSLLAELNARLEKEENNNNSRAG